MHYDPLLRSARKPFASFGHVWVVLALWVPLPCGTGRGFALPVLLRLYVSAKRGGERHRAGRRQGRVGPRLRAARTAHAKRRQVTKPELLREMVALVAQAQWAGERTVDLVVESASAGRTVLEDRPPNVHVLSQSPAPGRGAVRACATTASWSARSPSPPWGPLAMPTLSQLIARQRRWTVLPVVLDGRAVTPRICTLDALW